MGAGAWAAPFVRKDSEVVGALVSALLAEQNTVEPSDERLRFARRGNRQQ
jgi:hypothetical protein